MLPMGLTCLLDAVEILCVPAFQLWISGHSIRNKVEDVSDTISFTVIT